MAKFTSLVILTNGGTETFTVTQKDYAGASEEFELLGCSSDSQASLRQTGLLFPNQNGNPRDAGNFRTRIFKPALARAGIKDLGLHGLRHLWGSAKLSSGSPQNVVQAYGGWASAQSMSVYSHLTPHDQAQEADIASLFDL